MGARGHEERVEEVVGSVERRVRSCERHLQLVLALLNNTFEYEVSVDVPKLDRLPVES